MEALGYAGIPGNGGLKNSYPSDAAPCQEPVRVSQLTQAIERHAKAISYVDDRLKLLQSRLGPMLRPTMPRETSANQKQMKEMAMAPFAEGMNQLASVIERLATDVDDLLSRLEL